MSDQPTTKMQVPAGGAQPGADDLGFELPKPAQVTKQRAVLIGVFVAVTLVVLFLAGFLPKFFSKRALASESEEASDALPRVEVFTAKELTSDRAMTLPGTVQPLEETVLYPRASGYVRRWLADMGSNVKEGDVLLEIDTPELDAQIEQARAQLAESEAGVLRAQSSVKFSKSTVDRYERLTPAGVASQQELEQRQGQAGIDEANVGVAKANVAAAQANLRRLMQGKAFSKVVAPFSGRVVQRSVERGMLVTAGTANPLFKLQSTDPVRIFIQVPQDVAPSVRTGVDAKVMVREYPGKTFQGEVARSAGSLDEVSRTMSIEVRVPNPDNLLLSGMYVQVALTLPTPHRLFEIPATALYSDSRGTRVAIIGAGNTVSMRKVTIERDTGMALQISSGLVGDEKIVKLANAALDEGSKVQLIKSAAVDAGR